MAWPAWFETFCRPEADRRKVLTQALDDAGIVYDALDLGGFRHVQVRGARPLRPVEKELILIAHYDRVPGSPGANDNGASVLALVGYLSGSSDRSRRVVFTDGEELTAGEGASAQGSYALARWWGQISVTPLVFDMTGVGDTWVLGKRGQTLIRQVRGDASPTALDPAARQRVWAKRWLASCGSGRTVEAELPFSDDLGFLAARIPAIQISVLPRKEALVYARDPSVTPPCWATMHRPTDSVETLWPSGPAFAAQALGVLARF